MSFDAFFDILQDLFNAGAVVGSAVSESARRAEVAARRARWVRELQRQIASAPLGPLSQTGEGPAQLEGRARPGQLMVAPLSRRPVIGFRLRLEGRGATRPEMDERGLILDVCYLNEFELEDPSSAERARVQPDRCLPLLAPELPHTLGVEALIKPPFDEILVRHAVSGSQLVDWVSFQATEHLLEPGEPVLVIGTAHREPCADGPSAGYREAPSRLVLTAPAGGVLIVADRHRDALLQALTAEQDLVPET